jgi:hypothetical protein
MPEKGEMKGQMTGLIRFEITRDSDGVDATGRSHRCTTTERGECRAFERAIADTHPHPLGPFGSEAEALKPETDARLTVALFVGLLVAFLWMTRMSRRKLVAHTRGIRTFLRMRHV